MTDTANLGLPFIEASQAQKHVTHNDALRILDAAIQIAVLDMTRTTPPPSPAEGERHVVASAPTGAWAGQAKAIATWQDGAWAFLAPKSGWCIWSLADAVMFVFDGAVWRDLRNIAVDNVAHFGVNTTASAPNLLSVKSNAAVFAAINAADGGSGDVRLQVSKESATKTASMVFADNYSGRAEFGLVGSDAFRLKVSSDGASFVDAFVIDQSTGNLTLPRGVALTGIVAPAVITANQNDYNPAGLASASVLQLSTDAARSVSGLAGGVEGRVICVINVGSQPLTLLDESASSSAPNRFTLGGSLTIPAKQAALLRYDGAALRWQAIAGASGLRASNNLSDLSSAATSRTNLGIPAIMRGYLSGLTLSTAGSSSTFGVAAGVAVDTASADTMMLAAALTKTTAAWAAGSGNGALDTGTIANGTWYHVHLIKRADTGVIDVLISTSVSAPTLPTNYTMSRRIGSLLTNGSAQWVAFTQIGDDFIWSASVGDINVSTLGTTPTAFTVTTPRGLSCIARMRGVMAASTANIGIVYSPLQATQVINAPAGNGNFVWNGSGAYSYANFDLRTNASSQIVALSGVSSTLFQAVTYGWIDRRGRDD